MSEGALTLPAGTVQHVLESRVQILPGPTCALVGTGVKGHPALLGYMTQEQLHWPFAVLHRESQAVSGVVWKIWALILTLQKSQGAKSLCSLCVSMHSFCFVYKTMWGFLGVLKAKYRGCRLCPIPSLYVTVINNLLCR